jgi:hypothetical protein
VEDKERRDILPEGGENGMLEVVSQLEREAGLFVICRDRVCTE